MKDLDKAEELVSDGLLKIADAARFTGLSVSKLYALMATGELAFTRIGRARRIPKLGLIRLAARNLVDRQDA
jgi:excisionase family DNA binding protein